MIRIILCITLLISGLRSFGKENLPVRFDDILSIHISAPGDWFLEIRPDGAASINLGALADDSAEILKGTFSIAALYTIISAQQVEPKGPDAACWVSIFYRDGSRKGPIGLTGRDAKPIFAKAFQSLDPEYTGVARVQSLIKEFPIDFGPPEPAESAMNAPKPLKPSTTLPWQTVVYAGTAAVLATVMVLIRKRRS